MAVVPGGVGSVRTSDEAPFLIDHNMVPVAEMRHGDVDRSGIVT